MESLPTRVRIIVCFGRMLARFVFAMERKLCGDSPGLEKARLWGVPPVGHKGRGFSCAINRRVRILSVV